MTPGWGQDCDEGFVADCSGDGDCCNQNWIGDSNPDCIDQIYGCDLTCYENDGGDCDGGVLGCLDIMACNFNSEATLDNGSCWYPNAGCNCDDGQGAVTDECGVCNGLGGIFECGCDECCNMLLEGNLYFDQGSSDITGFYQDGREFAVVGLMGYDAAAFVDITDPKNPFEVGRIEGTPSVWRDIKYWNRHVYIGTEAQDGVKVVNVDNPDNPYWVNTIYDFSSSHNIYIDADGYLYIIGAGGYDLWIYELTYHPANPVLVGTWDGEYFHDIEVYNNKLYGAAIYSGRFYILDVSDKTNPYTILNHYTGGGGTHDCAVTYDENYLITADETGGGHIKIWDISEYENINMISEYMTDPFHSVHNVYIRPETNLVIMSYYVDGTRVLDISNPENPVEVGYYDTSRLTGLFDGNWGSYAYLPSGYIISSDQWNGLFIFDSPLTNSEMIWSECIDDIYGCTDPEASNYNPDAAVDDDSCIYECVLGDVNCDGDINVQDVVIVVDCALQIGYGYECYDELGDVNEDGVINILDVVILVNWIVNGMSEDTVMDIDGNIYQTVQIGNQLWMAENLKTTRYQNGENITNYYSHDAEDPSVSELYGYLYDSYVVSDEREVCPINYHIPSDDEWKELELYLGMDESELNNIGWRGADQGSMLAGNEDLWEDGQLVSNGAFGFSGFNALPAGYINTNVNVTSNISKWTYYWSSSAVSKENFMRREIRSALKMIRRYDYYCEECGYSIRCLKD